MDALPPKLLYLLNFVRDHQAKQGRIPLHRESAEHLGCSWSRARHLYEQLVERGLAPRRGRGGYHRPPQPPKPKPEPTWDAVAKYGRVCVKVPPRPLTVDEARDLAEELISLADEIEGLT